MRSPTILLASGLVLVGCVITACSAPELKRRPSATCKASDDDCPAASSKSRTDSSGDELGLPEAARAEDQEEPPPEALAATDERMADGGTTTTSDGGGAAAKPTLNETNACWAGTLNAFVEKNGCYQRKSDGMWFQCGFDTASQKNAWFRNVVDGVGRFGTCSSLHPLN